MWPNYLWQRWLRKPTGSARPLRKRQPRRRTRLGLEPLEDRVVPTIYSVDNRDVAGLISTINSVNRDTQADTIVLAPNGVYDLTAVNNRVNGPNGLPAITTTYGLTIEGNGATIERSSAAGTAQLRLLEMAAGVSLTLRDLTLANGVGAEPSVVAAAGSNGSNGPGGALYMAGGTLSVFNTTFSGDVADGGRGGIGSDGGSGGSGQGGALYMAGGTLSVTDSTFAADTAAGGAGANGTMRGGSGGSGEGGALYMAGGTVSVADTSFAGDGAQGGAAPTFNGSVGGAGGTALGGALYMAGGVLSVTDSNLSADTAAGGVAANGSKFGGFGGFAQGGALCTIGGTVSLTNSTFYADAAEGAAAGNGGIVGGPGGFAQGGALFATASTVSVTNSTFTANVVDATPGGAGGNAGPDDVAQGGALYLSGASVLLSNTIVVGDTGGDLFNNGGVIAASFSFNNLIGTLTGGGLTNGQNGNQMGVSAAALELAPLGNYGGPTQTIALLPGSIAIGAGDLLAVPDGLTTDQRGSPRITNGHVDIGAFQSQGFQLTASAGSDQTATVGQALTTPLTATVVANDPNIPVNDLPVTFTVVPSGNGAGLQANSYVVATGNNGQAQLTSAVANTIPGAYTVIAAWNGMSVSFNLTNVAGAPARINTVFGNGQATVGNPFGTSLEAQVTDGNGNPVAGVNVTFTESNGTGGAGADFGIAWGPLTPITTDVATLTQPGTLVEATQWGNTGTIAVTGPYGTIHFQQASIDGGGGPVADTTAAGVNTGAFSGTTGNVSFDSVLNGYAYDETSSPYHTLTIFNLTPGQQYSVQLFSVDDRNGESGRTISYSDTSGDLSDSFTEGSNSYVIGTFIAAGATETLHVNLASGNLGNINALVVRSLSGNGITVQTNAAGIATAPVLTANDIAGSFSVQVADAADGLSDAVQLTNRAGAAANITTISGGTQSTIVGAAFGTLLQAEVTDASGNPVANAPVFFSVPASGASGSLDASPLVYTNAQGIATAPELIANHVRGSFVVTATTAGAGSSAAFSLTNTAVPAHISIMGGNKQQTVVDTSYASPLQVKVTDSSGKPISDIAVEFAVEANNGVGATFPGSATVFTAANGVATAPALTAGGTAGTFTVEAWAAGLAAPAIFTLTSTPGSAAHVTPVVNTLSATVGKSYTALQALVTDAHGNPVSGVKVTFTAPTGTHVATGTFNGKTSFTATTGANGVASAPLTANTIAGTFTVTAAVNGVNTPASFSLTNEAGAPVKMAVVSGNKQSVAGNAAFAALEVQVTDSFGNLLNNVQVTFTVQASKTSGAGGTFSGTGTAKVNTANGLATAPQLTANAKPGKFTVMASVAGTTASATFTLEIS